MANNEEMVHKYIVGRGGKVKPSQCAQELDLTEEEVRSALDSLMKQGKLKKKGESEKVQQKAVDGDSLAAESKSIKEQITKLPGQVAAGELTLSEYEVRRAELEQRLQEIKKDMEPLAVSSIQSKSSIAVGMKPEAIYDLVKEREKIKSWIDNIDAKKDTLSEEVFNNVKQDYESRHEKIQDTLSDSVGGLRKLLEGHSKEKERLAFELENLEARHIAGELDEKNSKAIKAEFENKVKQTNKEITFIEEIIEKIG